jgi:hypothetical protein
MEHYQLWKLKSFVDLAGIETELETKADNFRRFQEPVICVL